MRGSTACLGLIVWMAWGSAALAIEGTVRLKNGGFIHGDVLEHLPGERVSVRTSDGSVRNISWEEVERVEEGAVAAPGPAAVPANPPPSTAAERASSYRSPPPPEEPWGNAGHAPDDERFNDVTLTLFGLAGPLGNAAVDVDLTVTQGGLTDSISDSSDIELELSYGGGAQLDIPLHRYFSLAPQIRLTSWRADTAEGDRSALFIDFLVSPRLRFPFVLSPGAIGVPYVQIPLGISYVDFPSGSADDLSVSPALTAGVSAGFLALLSKHVGLSIEIGWQYRSFSADYSQDGATSVGAFTAEYETDWGVTQATLQLGLAIAF